MGAIGRAVGTLGLTFLGGMLGPASFAVYGSAIGSMVGGFLFAPTGKMEGFRLGELDYETSEYGVSINRFFGTMRTAGIAIDGRHVGGVARCIREEKKTEKKGDLFGIGGTEVTEYKYWLSVAIQWGFGPLIVEKIWFEDNKEKKLIFNRAGTTNEEKGYVLTPVTDSFGRVVAEVSDKLDLFHGYATQPVSSYLQSQHGGEAPAYVGKSYAVFKEFRLRNGAGKFMALVRDPNNQNRRQIIERSLSECDYPAARTWLDGMNEPISAHSTGGGAVLSNSENVGDFASKIALLSLQDLGHVDGLLQNRPRANPLYHQLSLSELGAAPWSDGDNETELIKFQPVSVYELPSALRINFQDINLNYEKNWVRSSRETAAHENEFSIELPVASTLQEMQYLCDVILNEYWVANATLEIQLLPGRLNVGVGDVLLVPDDGGAQLVYYPMRVTEQSVSPDGIIACKGPLYDWAVYGQSRPMPGLVIPPDVVSVPSVPVVGVFDVPALSDAMAETAGVMVAVCGARGSYWANAVFAPSNASLPRLDFLTEATLGEIVTGFSFDEIECGQITNRVIRLRLENGELAPCSESAMRNNFANELAIQTATGCHVLRFGDAVLTNPATGEYEITEILAGRYGTDHTLSIPAGSKCVLLRDASGALAQGVSFLNLPDTQISQSVVYTVSTDTENPKTTGTQTLVCRGETLKPRSVVNVRVKSRAASSIRLEWNARTRYEQGASWAMTRPSDGDNYEVRLLDGAMVKLTKTVTNSTEAHFTHAELMAVFGSLPAQISGEVRQISARVGLGHKESFGPFEL